MTTNAPTPSPTPKAKGLGEALTDLVDPDRLLPEAERRRRVKEARRNYWKKKGGYRGSDPARKEGRMSPDTAAPAPRVRGLNDLLADLIDPERQLPLNERHRRVQEARRRYWRTFASRKAQGGRT